MPQDVKNVMLTFFMLVTTSLVGAVFHMTRATQQQVASKAQVYKNKQLIAERILEARLQTLNTVTAKPATVTEQPAANSATTPTSGQVAADQASQRAAQLAAQQQAAQLQQQIQAAQLAQQQAAAQAQMQAMQQARLTRVS